MIIAPDEGRRIDANIVKLPASAILMRPAEIDERMDGVDHWGTAHCHQHRQAAGDAETAAVLRG
jgi:hypothetical protein